MPNLVLAQLVMGAVKWLNSFPSNTGIEATLTPREIIQGRPVPDCRNLTLNLGLYVHVYNGTMNNQKSLTVVLIQLIPSNEKGGSVLLLYQY